VAFALVRQPDGKLVAAGYSYFGSHYAFALARYNPDGSLDRSFNHTGTVTTAFSWENCQAFALVRQPDGKLVAAGYRDTYSRPGFALARYNSNGTLDKSFHGKGTVATAVGSDDSEAYALVLQPDGKLVAAGTSYVPTGGVAHSQWEFALARYRGSTLTVAKAGTGAGTVRSSPDGISCGATCSAPFAAVRVTLSASAAAGSRFAGWSGSGCTGTGTCRISLSSDTTVTATFTLEPSKKIQCVVPKLKGKKLVAAKRAIRTAHCSLGKITRAYSATVKKGRVVSQRPAHGRHLKKGSRVNLVVSRGKRPMR
jgi:uncharacterized delta-60 repeat protein